MCGAVGAIVAVDGLAGVAVVGIGLQPALGDLQGGFGNDLVEGVATAAELLAGVAVAVGGLVVWLMREGLRTRGRGLAGRAQGWRSTRFGRSGSVRCRISTWLMCLECLVCG